jgi:hypothetical protein
MVDPMKAFRRMGGRGRMTIDAVTPMVSLVSRGAAAASAATLLDTLELLHWLQRQLAATEPILIDAARKAGVSWQDLAPALGVASRQAAERRYLRLLPARADQAGTTRDERVREVRDKRASERAVAQRAEDLLGEARPQLDRHPVLAEQVDAVTASTEGVRRRKQRIRDGNTAGASATRQRKQ